MSGNMWTLGGGEWSLTARTFWACVCMGRSGRPEWTIYNRSGAVLSGECDTIQAAKGRAEEMLSAAMR